MPRDKSVSHIKVNKAIREEFLEKGYEAASIRSIGARAGMTSAGLYRHYPDKESMFAAVVEPLIKEIRDWTDRHMEIKYKLVDERAEGDQLFQETFMDLLKQIIWPRREEFKLLLTCSSGSKYENFIHEFVAENQKAYIEAINMLKKNGYPVMEVEEEELHMLLSAYITACFEPIIHDYDKEKIDRYLDTIQEFFQPGWMKIMGVN